jgi:hypothetical protein
VGFVPLRPICHAERSTSPGQQRRVAEKKVLKFRAVRVLSLGIWQAFAIVTLFSLLQGVVMGGDNSANLDDASEQSVIFVHVAGIRPSKYDSVRFRRVIYQLSHIPMGHTDLDGTAFLLWRHFRTYHEPTEGLMGGFGGSTE